MYKNIFIYLKLEIFIFILTLLLSSGVFVSSIYFYNLKLIEKQVNKKNLENTKKRYRLGLENKRIYSENIRNYKQLEDSGLIANENRLNWLSSIDEIAKQLDIPKIKYNIEKQRLIKDASLNIFYPNINIYKSTMTLSLSLLHDGDILNVFKKIDVLAKGKFDVYSCNFKRNYIDIKDVIKDKKNMNIVAQCQLDWITIKNKRT